DSFSSIPWQNVSLNIDKNYAINRQFSLADLKIGDMIAKGCNAAVYSACFQQPKSTNTNRHGAKTVFYLMVLWCLDYRSCTFPPMNQLTNYFDAVSSVAQNNQGCARGLVRGPCPTSKLQSPFILKILKILQCNLATRVKLDQLLKMAEANNVQAIALQLSKLKIKTILKYRGYNIYRKGRPTKGGGGLAFFVQDINYKSIDTPVDGNPYGFSIFIILLIKNSCLFVSLIIWTKTLLSSETLTPNILHGNAPVITIDA
ncbi:hypothetical protein AVEN_218224-1, partial [Araneus ventricosus]